MAAMAAMMHGRPCGYVQRMENVQSSANLRWLVQSFGVERAFEICAAFGGIRVFIPKRNLVRASKFSQFVTTEEMAAFQERWDGDYFKPPVANVFCRQFLAFSLGLTSDSIARLIRADRSTVEKSLRRDLGFRVMWPDLSALGAQHPILESLRRRFDLPENGERHELSKLRNLLRKDNETDDNVFFNKKYIYGTQGRCNAGFGLWQLAYASREDLTAENYEAARVAMMELRGDEGRALGVRPNMLVCPPSLEGAAMRLLNNGTRIVVVGEDDAATPVPVQNEWAGTAKPIVTPWLSA